MKKIKRTYLLAALLISCSVFAQKPAEVSVKLRDGSNVTGTAALPDVTLITDYGKLQIPLKNVSSIKVGIPTDKAVTEKAIAYLKQLSSTSEDAKKGAYEELIKLGVKAIPAIDAFMNDSKNQNDYTGEYTPDNAINELRSTNGIDANTSDKDEVTIENGYLMGGVFEFTKLDVKTEYGNLSIPKEKIKNIDVTYMGESGSNEMTFKLMGSKNISSNQNGGWLKTGIMLKNGQKFSVIATGEIVLASLSNQKYHPDGSYETATGEKYPTTAATDEYSTTTAYPSYGNVVYKIGETSTQTLKAGAKLNGTAVGSGMLYLAVYETVFNAANSGSYSVRVILK
ncbi:MAG TPA: hypothetical protein VNZ49_11465 [Bacteroidia bacterium]|jgi:hypothetical protein|nr:hypothetical protein [Bacteroidia bacterium]